MLPNTIIAIAARPSQMSYAIGKSLRVDPLRISKQVATRLFSMTKLRCQHCTCDCLMVESMSIRSGVAPQGLVLHQSCLLQLEVTSTQEDSLPKHFVRASRVSWCHALCCILMP